jgi:hypothetical protein
MTEPIPRAEPITLRNLDLARRYPQELPEDVPRRRRGERHVCPVDGTPLAPVVVTTFGDAGDPAVWRAYPLALDGWLCATGAHFDYAFLTTAEVQQFLRSGGGAAQAGDLDTAEFFFRRVVSSWPGFAAGRVNLGSLYLDRVKAAQAAGGSPAEVRRLVDVAAAQFEKALACDPPPPAQVRLMLARIYARSERGELARPHLEAVLDDPAANDALIAQAEELLAEIAPDGGDLSSPGEPATKPAQVAHPYLQLALPQPWTRIEPSEYFALFEGPHHEAVNVVIAEAPAPRDAEAILAESVNTHEQSLRKNHARCDAGPTEVLRDDAVVIEARRRFHVQDSGPPWSVFARYVMSKSILEMRDGRRVQPYVQMTYYGSAWGASPAVVEAICEAVVLPVLRAPASRGAASPPLVPYLVTSDHVSRRDALLAQNGRRPEGAAGLLTLAPGVHLTVAADLPEGANPLFGADLAARGRTIADALVEARRTVAARLGTEELPVRTYAVTPWAIPPVWRPGIHPVVKGTDTAKVLVVGPSWMAAGAAATGALFERASRELGTKELRMVIPHRDCAFVFAEGTDEKANEALAAGIVRAEADGAKPISDRMFGLDAGGVTPAGRRALQWTLLSMRKGASRAEVEAQLPVDGTWKWVPGENGEPDSIRGAHWRAPPFWLVFEFVGDALRSARVRGSVRGEYDAFVDLDTKLRQSLPDLELTRADGRPWSVEQARGAPPDWETNLMASLPGFGRILGVAYGFPKDGAHVYGFDLAYGLGP